MNNKILIAAFAGLSLFAAAQSPTDKDKPKSSTSQTQTKSPRDAASGQATGRLEQKNIVHRDLAARDLATGHATGKKTAQDDWHQSAAKPASSSSDDAARGQTTGKRQYQPVTIIKETDKASTHVATGDVNGDGIPDVAASKNSAHATEAAASTTAASSKDHAPRDAASGQASGKRMHQPVTVLKEKDKAPQ